jgi:2-keto-3-deoxy-L-rhamnonate aldolase RhmA
MTQEQARTTLKHRLRAGELLCGAVINIAHPLLIEAVCSAGADFLFIDFAHGLRDYSDLGNAILAAERHDVPALVRLGERSANLAARVLDAGAAGFLFPHVESAEEAAELVSWCRYKPLGVRGSGFTRTAFSSPLPDRDRRAQENDDVVCIMIVESLAGKDNLAAILAVDGVTGIAIGPGDISLELGGLAWNDPQVDSILGDMAATIKATPDRTLLRLAQSPADAASHVKGGANMLILTHDGTLIREMYAEKFAGLRGGGG